MRNLGARRGASGAAAREHGRVGAELRARGPHHAHEPERVADLGDEKPELVDVGQSVLDTEFFNVLVEPNGSLVRELVVHFCEVLVLAVPTPLARQVRLDIGVVEKL